LLPWLEAQAELYDYLSENAEELAWREEAAGLFHLVPPPGEVRELQRLRISRRISPNDLMYASGPDGYFRFGRSGLHCVREAIKQAGHKAAPESVLDFACGHGRVLRFMRAFWPQAEIVACDIDRDAVDFCTAQFAATPLYSELRPSEIALDRQVDAIWVGSLLTHLDEARWDAVLGFLVERLKPGGVLVFTFHGECIAERLRAGDKSYWVPDRGRLLEDWVESGFGYQNYPDQEGYGFSLSSDRWVRDRVARIAGARVLAVWPRAWFVSHDVAVVTDECVRHTR
jgi:SAM-dependent methyltransferase